MILITTAIKETFPEDVNKEVLFLGEWCKNYSDDYWKNFNSKTLDYHWDDREKLFQSANYTNNVYEKYLIILSSKLNEIHGEKHDIRYWRIVIGPWLIRFIQIIYDKYVSIENAFSENKIDMTYVLDIKEHEATPFDMLDFNRMNTSDSWNHFIYSLLIEKKHCKIVKITAKKGISHLKIPKYSIKNMVKKISRRLNRLNKVAFYASYIEKNTCAKLQLQLGQMPALDYFDELSIPAIYDQNLRKELKISAKNTDIFESILASLIVIQIPCSYLESYHKVKKVALKRYALNPVLIVTAIAPVSFDDFKIWLAEKVEGGCKFLYIQHGGYGAGLFDPQELHEIMVADQFYSWGWNRDGYDSIKPMPVIKLLEKINYNPNGDILVPLMSSRRYPSSLFASALSSQVLSNIKDQINFLSLLSSKTRESVKLRTFSNDYGWHIAKRIADCGFSNVIDSKKNLNKKFINRMSECRLCIATYNGTTYLETFSSNFPTLLFWNKNYWEINQHATPYFDQLHDVGILHYDAESLAKKVEEIYQNPKEWWMTEAVQRAKNEFCSEFANIDGDVIGKWYSELKEQLTVNNSNIDNAI
jgi:putative transferase (TIGR04331 family)